MTTANLLLLALALAMDAFAVAITTGAQLPRVTARHVFRLAFHFGLFQAIMPILGWFAGNSLHAYIEQWDHWVAFGLLTFIGIKMIRESLAKEDAGGKKHCPDPTRGLNLLMLAVATSIDALAVGFSLSMLGLPIWLPAGVIGLVCFAVTAAGMYIGRQAARMSRLGLRAGLAGGLVLIGIGLRILWEHGVFQ